MGRGNKELTNMKDRGKASGQQKEKTLNEKIQRIKNVNDILSLDDKFLTTKPKESAKSFATVEDLRKSEGKTHNLLVWLIGAVVFAVVTLLADARRDHWNLDKIISLQNDLNDAIIDNKNLREEIKNLREEFDWKLQNEVNKAIIEGYKWNFQRR